jgi:Fe-S-cluster containining protein
MSQSGCLSCAKLDRSCCTAGHPFLVVHDILRAYQELGRHPTKIFSLRAFIISQSANRSLGLNSLTARLSYHHKGRTYRLEMIRPNGWCIALEDGAGCTLGDSRPLICKLFPFLPVPDYCIPISRSSKATIYLSRECYIVNVLDFKTENICKYFGETISQKHAQLEQWEREVQEHTQLLQKASDLNILPNHLLNYFIDTLNSHWQKE